MAAFLLSLGTVWLGPTLPTPDLPPDAWSGMMMVYAFVASILPVWLLLQPRDYLNSLLLYLGLISLFAGFFVLRPEFVAPAVDLHPPGAPPLFPFVFVGVPILADRYLSSALSVASIGAFAFLKIDGQPAGLALWALFGTTN